MESDPIKKFSQWWDKALEGSSLRQGSAACLSTIGSDGYPNGRFISLKSIENRCFIFCTSLESHKGREILRNPKVAITIWWDHAGLQVRIQGTALKSPERDSIRHWQNRSRDAQIVSSCSDQSKKISTIESFQERFGNFHHSLSKDSAIPKPADWACFSVRPIQIEFLTFNENRFHMRELYEKKDGKWEKSLLQP